MPRGPPWQVRHAAPNTAWPRVTCAAAGAVLGAGARSDSTYSTSGASRSAGHGVRSPPPSSTNEVTNVARCPVPPVQPSIALPSAWRVSSASEGIPHSALIFEIVWTSSSIGSGWMKKSIVPARQPA